MLCDIKTACHRHPFAAGAQGRTGAYRGVQGRPATRTVPGRQPTSPESHAAAAAHKAGSRIPPGIASMPCNTSGDKVVPQAFRFSLSCATEVTPMMVLLTCHLV